jgi:hypothetical protein
MHRLLHLSLETRTRNLRQARETSTTKPKAFWGLVNADARESDCLRPTQSKYLPVQFSVTRTPYFRFTPACKCSYYSAYSLVQIESCLLKSWEAPYFSVQTTRARDGRGYYEQTDRRLRHTTAQDAASQIAGFGHHRAYVVCNSWKRLDYVGPD